MKNLISFIIGLMLAVSAQAQSIKYNLATTNQAFGFLQGANVTIVTNANGSITITASATPGTALTNASLTGTQLINPLTNAVLTLNSTNGMGIFTNASGVVIGLTNSGAALGRSLVTLTNRYTTAIVADYSTNWLSSTGLPIGTNTYTTRMSDSVILVRVKTMLSVSTSMNIGGAFFSNGTHLATQVIGSATAINRATRPVIEWEYTNNAAPGTVIQFSFNVAPEIAGSVGVNRYTSADTFTTNQAIQIVVEERIP